MKKVENLNQTAGVLGENMEELKTEISVFKRNRYRKKDDCISLYNRSFFVFFIWLLEIG